MLWENRRVVFADETLESDYRRLTVSAHPEDVQLHSILRTIRTELRRRWRRGKRITNPRVASRYERMYQAPNVWRLRLHRYGTVIYSVLERTIRILDIL